MVERWTKNDGKKNGRGGTCNTFILSSYHVPFNWGSTNTNSGIVEVWFLTVSESGAALLESVHTSGVWWGGVDWIQSGRWSQWIAPGEIFCIYHQKASVSKISQYILLFWEKNGNDAFINTHSYTRIKYLPWRWNYFKLWMLKKKRTCQL